MTNFPTKPIKNFLIEDLTSYLVQLKSMGLNIYRIEGYENIFEIELNQTNRIQCIFNSPKCQVKLLTFENMTNLLDVTDKVQLENVVSSFIENILGAFPVTSHSARVSSDTPASNYQSISNLIGSSEIIGVFDPYLENSSLTTLITICSFGHGKIGNNIRLLGSNKKSGGTNPTYTKAGVDAFITEKNISGEGKILSSNSEHRRFLLLTGGKSLLLGHSLNAIHKNEAIRIESDTEDLEFFDSMWQSATSLP
jgi:hypothetical protein